MYAAHVIKSPIVSGFGLIEHNRLKKPMRIGFSGSVDRNVTYMPINTILYRFHSLFLGFGDNFFLIGPNSYVTI